MIYIYIVAMLISSLAITHINKRYKEIVDNLTRNLDYERTTVKWYEDVIDDIYKESPDSVNESFKKIKRK